MVWNSDSVFPFFFNLYTIPKTTIFIITGDHGYDLGDRGVSLGHTNIRHETNWVPLIIYSNHPSQPKGRQLSIASHVDITPTLLDILGICDDNSFMGHSLLTNNKYTYAINILLKNMAFETEGYSAFFPHDDEPFLYSSSDFLQMYDISADNKVEVNELFKRAHIFSEVVDYIIEKNLILP